MYALRRQPEKAVTVQTCIAAALVGQALFGVMCGVALLMLAAAFRIWPSKLLRMVHPTVSQQPTVHNGLEEYLGQGGQGVRGPL